MTDHVPTLETERLHLTPFDMSELDELLAMFQDPEVRRFLLDDQLVDREWVRSEVETSRERFGAGSGGLWSVRLQENAQLIGHAGFREFFDPPELQLLYGLVPSAWGRGLATEAARAACEYGFQVLGFESIPAAIDVPNVRSGRVLERLGFEETRRLDEGPEGTICFALSRAAWESTRQ